MKAASTALRKLVPRILVRRIIQVFGSVPLTKFTAIIIVILQNRSELPLYSSKQPHFGTPMHSSPSLGINHQSPLIYWEMNQQVWEFAGNQSPIPFDILLEILKANLAVLGINHQSPLIYCRRRPGRGRTAGNQSPIPFDILEANAHALEDGWESITNPL